VIVEFDSVQKVLAGTTARLSAALKALGNGAERDMRVSRASAELGGGRREPRAFARRLLVHRHCSVNAVTPMRSDAPTRVVAAGRS